MKSYTHLWEVFISKENFELALNNALRKKKKYRQIRTFLKNRDENLEQVRQMVMRGDFHTSEYRPKTIYEPKERIIYKLPFAPDRIVQHAASLKCSEFVRRNRYCLKCDVRKFYPSIDQKTLSAMFHKIIRDKKFLVILDDIIFSFEGGKNCPIGNYCSQWFGNFYLTRLDDFIKHGLRCRDYERYCDDFLLYSNDKKYLNDCREKIGEFLRDTLFLAFSKCDLFDVRQGVDFCGYRHFGKYVLLRKSTAKRTKRRFQRGVSPQSAASTAGWCKWACTYNFRRSLGLIPRG